MWLISDPLMTTFLRSFLALLFAGAALSKLRHQDELKGVVRNFRLMPEVLAAPFATALPWLELAVAAGLLVDPAVPYAAAGASGLLALFAVAIGINVARGRKAIDCGCFRTGYKQTLSWLLVLRNVALAGAGLGLLLLTDASRVATWADVAAGAFAAAVAMLLYITFSLLSGVAATARDNSHLA